MEQKIDSPKSLLLIVISLSIMLIVGYVIYSKQPPLSKTNPESVKNEVNISEDVCSEFPREWIQSVIGKTIIDTKQNNSTITHVCEYYVDENNFVALRLNNLSFENQKKGQQALGRTIIVNDKISLNHFIALQDNNLINDVVLEINPNLFLAIDRSSTKAASEDEIVKLAIGVANKINNPENTTIMSPTIKNETTVPLPLETDIVRSFISNIDEDRPSDAVKMMNPKILENDGEKQAYAVMYNAFEKMKVISIEPSMQSDWTDTVHTYKVKLDVKMKPEAANAQPIPNYGWDNGENIRWIGLEKINDKWIIQGFATGP